MRKFVVAIVLLLGAICASTSPVEQQEQSFIKRAVDHYIEFCGRQILADWLRIPALFGLEHLSLHEQGEDCQWWFKTYDMHLRKFAGCYEYGFDKMHGRIRETASDDELQMHERRMNVDKICNNLQGRVRIEFGNDWSKVPQNPPKPVDETLSVETCAENNLVRGESFMFPAAHGFYHWSRRTQENHCEAAYERALQTGIEACTSKYRVSDYLASYSKRDKKRYDEITEGRKACEPILNIKWDWSEELPVEKSAGEKTSAGDTKE